MGRWAAVWQNMLLPMSKRSRHRGTWPLGCQAVERLTFGHIDVTTLTQQPL